MTDLKPKQGWKTSEFWVALVPTAIIVLKVFGIEIDEAATTNAVLAISAAVSVGYGAVRTWLKVNRIKFAPELAQAASGSASTFTFTNPSISYQSSGTTPYVAADEEDVEEVPLPEDLKDNK